MLNDILTITQDTELTTSGTTSGSGINWDTILLLILFAESIYLLTEK